MLQEDDPIDSSQASLDTKSTSRVPEKRPRRKWLIFFSIATAALILACILWWLFRQPSWGTLVTHTSPAGQNPAAADLPRAHFDGKYVTFLYDARYLDRSPAESVKKPLLERFFGAQSTIEGKKLSLIVQDNTGYAFEEYSAYRIREMDREKYTQEKIVVNGSIIILFETHTPVYEAAAFVGHRQLVASLVLSSPTSDAGLRDELVAILETLRWQNDPPSGT